MAKVTEKIRGILQDRAAAKRSKNRLKAMDKDVEQTERAQADTWVNFDNARNPAYRTINDRYSGEGRSGESLKDFTKREGVRARVKRATSTY